MICRFASKCCLISFFVIMLFAFSNQMEGHESALFLSYFKRGLRYTNTMYTDFLFHDGRHVDEACFECPIFNGKLICSFVLTNFTHSGRFFPLIHTHCLNCKAGTGEFPFERHNGDCAHKSQLKRNCHPLYLCVELGVELYLCVSLSLRKARWPAKMASIEFLIPLRNLHGPSYWHTPVLGTLQRKWNWI